MTAKNSADLKSDIANNITNSVGFQSVSRADVGASLSNMVDSSINTQDTSTISMAASLTTAGAMSAKAVLTPYSGELTIAAGVVTVTGTSHIIDTENDDPTDTLTTINGGEDGWTLDFHIVTSSRQVTLNTAGNLYLGGFGTVTLTRSDQTISFRYTASLNKWFLVGLGGAVPGTLTLSALTASGAVSITGSFITPRGAELTISGGVVTRTAAIHRIISEGGAGVPDNLDTISGGSDGMHLWLGKSASSGDITLTEAGNISIGGGASRTLLLSSTDQLAHLVYLSDVSKWILEYAPIGATLT